MFRNNLTISSLGVLGCLVLENTADSLFCNVGKQLAI